MSLQFPTHRALLLVASFLLATTLAVTTGCSSNVAQTRRSISGTKAERIAAVEKLLKRSKKSDQLPGAILDAQLEEIQVGANGLGPADYQTFVWIKVNPDDVASWENALEPRDEPIRPIAAMAPKWWTVDIDEDTAVFSPKSLFGRSNGWVVIQEDGQIFAFTFTM